jgi:drug/metabolite transporter (DMT)-like permease
VPSVNARAWVLFAVVSVVWGVPYYFIKVALDGGVPPTFLTWSRVALGALLLAPLAWRRGAFRGLGARWRPILAYSFCEIVVPFTLIALGEERIASSLAAILIASMPLMVAAIAFRFVPDERPTPVRLLGLCVGLAGVVALLGVDVAGDADEVVGAALVLVATLGYAIAPFIVQRRLSGIDPLGPVTASLVVASVVLLPLALTHVPASTPTAGAFAAIAVLGVVCTAAGLLLFFLLIAAAGPSRSSVVTYVNPLVAVLLGVAALGEDVTAGTVLGLALILLGSWIATRGVRETATPD